MKNNIDIVSLYKTLEDKILDNNLIEFSDKVMGIRDRAILKNHIYLLLNKSIFYDSFIDLMSLYNISLKNKKILEIGSGYGVFLIYALLDGLDIYGIEPGENEFNGRYELVQTILQNIKLPSDRLIKAIGEQIPFNEETFDIVFSNMVLEHTQDPKKVILESIRVLKPNGILFFNVPNFHSFFEGHYRIFWLPFLNKKLAKFYVKLFKRDPNYIDSLNFITPNYIKNILKSINGIEFVKPSHYKVNWDYNIRTLYDYLNNEPKAIKKMENFVQNKNLYRFILNLLNINKNFSKLLITILGQTLYKLQLNHVFQVVIKKL